MQRVSKFSHFFLFSAVLAAMTVFFVGCGSGSSSSGTRIRFVNAALSSTITSVNVLIDGTTVAPALANGGAATAYISVAAGARRIQIQDPSTSAFLIDTTPTISGNTTYIIKDFITNTNTPLILTDDNSAPTSGNFKLRAINLAPDLSAGTNVYVELSTITTLNGLTPTFSGLTFPNGSASSGAVSNYVTNTAGSWEVLFTPATSQGILAGGSAITFAAGQVETVLIVEDTSGNFTEVPLVDVQ